MCFLAILDLYQLLTRATSTTNDTVFIFMSHPENRYIQSVHRKLRPVKKQVPFYFAKLQVAGNNGFPDCWYSGPIGDLWSEYKWVSEKDFPTRDTSMIIIKLSPNQRNWLNQRHKEGRQVCCIVGSPKGSVIFHFPFPEKISVAHFISSAVNTDTVVEYILGKTAIKPLSESESTGGLWTYEPKATPFHPECLANGGRCRP